MLLDEPFETDNIDIAADALKEAEDIARSFFVGKAAKMEEVYTAERIADAIKARRFQILLDKDSQ